MLFFSRSKAEWREVGASYYLHIPAALFFLRVSVFKVQPLFNKLQLTFFYSKYYNKYYTTDLLLSHHESVKFSDPYYILGVS